MHSGKGEARIAEHGVHEFVTPAYEPGSMQAA